ncbi:hypothetical protein QQS21_003682 [Conoideocrella luteorostrata]|uniref:Uncharacterized protein n=1 Tax=Conoideocrella luteorostrata TaxID=1105319 RepID=A0AAJ0CT15_9HYPO|nr:hypothetical protein QQS21_003682 [Conoideocrella luteorostrata]
MSSAKKWEISAELDLCMAVIHTGGSVGSYKWPEVHAIMVLLGHNFTKDAISQHYTKSILRGFKKRHGLGSGRLATSFPSTGKRKADEQGAGSPTKKGK